MSNPINGRFIASPHGKKISIYDYLCFFGNMLRLFIKHGDGLMAGGDDDGVVKNI
jgi:hypothetical protein